MTTKSYREEGGGRNVSGAYFASVFLLPCSLLLFPLLASCKPKPADAPTPSERLKAIEAKAEKKIESLEQRFMRERTEYGERFHNLHLKLQARINELKRRAEIDVAKRPELERAIQKLEQRTQVLRERLQHIKSVSAENWDELKAPWQKKEGYEDYEDEILKETSM